MEERRRELWLQGTRWYDLRRSGLPRGARTWMHLAVAGFLLNALPFSLFAFAELTIPSTLAGIWQDFRAAVTSLARGKTRGAA